MRHLRAPHRNDWERAVGVSSLSMMHGIFTSSGNVVAWYDAEVDALVARRSGGQAFGRGVIVSPTPATTPARWRN